MISYSKRIPKYYIIVILQECSGIRQKRLYYKKKEIALVGTKDTKMPTPKYNKVKDG